MKILIFIAIFVTVQADQLNCNSYLREILNDGKTLKFFTFGEHIVEGNITFTARSYNSPPDGTIKIFSRMGSDTYPNDRNSLSITFTHQKGTLLRSTNDKGEIQQEIKHETGNPLVYETSGETSNIVRIQILKKEYKIYVNDKESAFEVFPRYDVGKAVKYAGVLGNFYPSKIYLDCTTIDKNY